MGAPKGLAEMSGDFLREAGVLVAALGVLEKTIAAGLPSWRWTVVVLGLGLFFAGFGAIIERTRSRS